MAKNKTRKKKQTEKAETTAIEVNLPGGKEVDPQLIDKAVSDLNGLYTKKGLETAEAIGAYLLKAFFKNDISNFNEYGKKHETFKMLAEHEGLDFSASYLWFAVPVYVQTKYLRENGITENLPLSHHRMLVAVKDEKKKLQFAKKAVAKGLSKLELYQEIKKYKDEEALPVSSGRPALPAFAKGLPRLLAAIDLATSEDITDTSFEHFDLLKTRDLLEKVDSNLGKLIGLRDNLRSRVATLETSNA